MTEPEKWTLSLGETVADNMFARMFLHPEYRGSKFTWASWGISTIKEIRSQVMMSSYGPDPDLIREAQKYCKIRYVTLVQIFVDVNFTEKDLE